MKRIFVFITGTFFIWFSCTDTKEIPAFKKPDPKILAIGNSITFHPPSSEVGWSGNWGMAASSAEKDYFALLEAMVHSIMPEADLMRENVYPFELGFEEFDFSFYNHLKEFQPDVLIIRFGENIREERVIGNELSSAIADFVEFLSDGREIEVIVTTTFWPNEKVNQQLVHIAESKGWSLVNLTDLGSMGENMAIGLFENGGVSIHPGDLGMERIAKRLYSSLYKLI